MRPRVDPARVAEQLAGKRVRGDALPHARRPVEEVGVGGPSASAASSRRFASRCSGTSAKVATDLLRELRDRQLAVDDDVPPWIRGPRARGMPPRRAPRARPRRARSGRRSPPTRAARSPARSRRSPSGREAGRRRRRGSARGRCRSRDGGHRPGRRRTSRRTGRRRRSRHARARAGSPGRRAARARRRRGRPPPTARRGRRGGRGRAPPRRAGCRPARGSSTTSTPSRSSASARSRAWVVLPEPSMPSKETNTGRTLDRSI